MWETATLYLPIPLLDEELKEESLSLLRLDKEETTLKLQVIEEDVIDTEGSEI